MEKYVLYEELPSCAQGFVHYKGRRRQSIHFVSIEKCDKAKKDSAANAVRRLASLLYDPAVRAAACIYVVVASDMCPWRAC